MNFDPEQSLLAVSKNNPFRILALFWQKKNISALSPSTSSKQMKTTGKNEHLCNESKGDL